MNFTACPANVWADGTSCFHCQGLTVQVEDVRIRATYSHRKRIPITEGFVEVKDGGKWRQICNEDWTQMNSRVICGMYGFPDEKNVNVRPYKWVTALSCGNKLQKMVSRQVELLCSIKTYKDSFKHHTLMMCNLRSTTHTFMTQKLFMLKILHFTGSPSIFLVVFWF